MHLIAVYQQHLLHKHFIILFLLAPLKFLASLFCRFFAVISFRCSFPRRVVVVCLYMAIVDYKSLLYHYIKSACCCLSFALTRVRSHPHSFVLSDGTFSAFSYCLLAQVIHLYVFATHVHIHKHWVTCFYTLFFVHNQQYVVIEAKGLLYTLIFHQLVCFPIKFIEKLFTLTAHNYEHWGFTWVILQVNSFDIDFAMNNLSQSPCILQYCVLTLKFSEIWIFHIET